jgi:predicted nucleic acid-binding Zn ribbon protein
MPVYTYRREDGTTFDIRQSFNDEPLKVDPQTGQRVNRVVQNAGVIFKGSGFYVNDSKNASKKSLTTPTSKDTKPETTTTSDSGGSSESSTSESKAVKEVSPIPQPTAGD